MYLSPDTHACYLYDPATSNRFAFQYLKAGLDRGECCYYVADDMSTFQAEIRFRDLGVDVETAQGRGALHVLTKHQTYLRTGTFDPGGMIEFLAETVGGAVRTGFSGVRIVGEMSCLLDCAGLMEYEAEVNGFFASAPLKGLCLYNMARFPEDVLHDALATHPSIVINGIGYSNPHYLPPQLQWDEQTSDRLHWLLHRIKESSEKVILDFDE